MDPALISIATDASAIKASSKEYSTRSCPSSSVPKALTKLRISRIRYASTEIVPALVLNGCAYARGFVSRSRISVKTCTSAEGADGAAGAGLCRRLIIFTTKKIANAMMRKLITVLMKLP